MRNPKIKKVVPNYRKRVLEIILLEKGRSKRYQLPFALVCKNKIGKENLFETLEIDKELGSQAVNFTLTDGTKGDFPSDYILYYCDPTYNWSPINQLKRALKEKLNQSHLSVRVLADALRTSPSQVVRLLEEDKSSKQLLQLFQLAELAGYEVQIQLKRKAA